jgi:hypothetical protein
LDCRYIVVVVVLVVVVVVKAVIALTTEFEDYLGCCLQFQELIFA